jgi:hypothetical protein
LFPFWVSWFAATVFLQWWLASAAGVCHSRGVRRHRLPRSMEVLSSFCVLDQGCMGWLCLAF